MIQDIEPKKLKNQYEDKRVKDTDYVMCFYGNQICISMEAGRLEFPKYWQLKHHFQKEERSKGVTYRYLFSVDEQNYFLLFADCKVALNGFSYVKMFEVRSYMPLEQIMAASTAWHLYVWYRDNRFCGRCSQPLLHDERQRMLCCPACGNAVFPKIAPAVIVGVVHGNKLLMTKYANRAYKRYALIAGFTEIGETAEQTVAREVLEEAGVRVKNIRYYKCQPWGFDSNLLLGYFAQLDGEEEITMDSEELSVAEWVSREEIEVEQDDRLELSLTHEMMMFFKNEERFLEFTKKSVCV